MISPCFFRMIYLLLLLILSAECIKGSISVNGPTRDLTHTRTAHKLYRRQVNFGDLVDNLQERVNAFSNDESDSAIRRLLEGLVTNPGRNLIDSLATLQSTFRRDDAENDENDNEDNDIINSYLNRLVSTIIQPILNPLPLTEAQKEVVIYQLVTLIASQATSRVQETTQAAITAGVSSVLQPFGLSEEQTNNITQRILQLTNAVFNPNSGGDGGDGGASANDNVDEEDDSPGLDLSDIIDQFRSSDEMQSVLRTLLTDALGQNGSLSGVLPPDLVAALGFLSSFEEAFRALTGIYSDRFATSQGCKLERSILGEGIRNFEPGPLVVLDSMGKPGTGILQGNSYFVGNFDQCMSLNYVTSSGDVIKGHYVKYNYVVNMPEGFPSIGGQVQYQEAGLPYIVWGVCLPQGCNHDDAQIVGQDVADGLPMELTKTAILTDRDPSDDVGFIFAVLLLSLLTLTCLIGTILDVTTAKRYNNTQTPKQHRPRATKQAQGNTAKLDRQPRDKGSLSIISEEPSAMRSPTGERSVNIPTFRDLRVAIGTVVPPPAHTLNREDNNSTNNTIPKENKPGAIWRMFVAFSVPRNTEQILQAKHNPGEITCLHGIRVISISWVILGHTYFFGPDYGNLTALLEMSKWWTFNAIRNAPYTVDTFFVLSGCLVAYLFLKTAKKAGGPKPIHMFFYYVHRYLRLTPLLAVAILFYACVTPYLEYGPFQKTITDREESCEDKWWWNILYINNLFDTSQFCMGWSWYLPNDMQFYVVAPIVIVPLALGYNLVGILVALVQISVHVITFTYMEEKYDATLSKNGMDYFVKIYIKPYTRCGPYAVGLLLGYAIFKTKFKAKMNMFVVCLGWVLALGGGLTLVFVTHDNYKDFGIIDPNWSSDVSNAYEIVARPLWAMCVAWMIFACSSGYGGVINSILSWRAWIPLSRLTYGVYLFHVMVIHYFNNNRRALAYFTKEFVIERYLATFILSYGLAFIASLLVETPVRNLTKPSSGKSRGRTENGRGVTSPASSQSNPKARKSRSKRVTFDVEPPHNQPNARSPSMTSTLKVKERTHVTPTTNGLSPVTPPAASERYSLTPTAPVMQDGDIQSNPRSIIGERAVPHTPGVNAEHAGHVAGLFDTRRSTPAHHNQPSHADTTTESRAEAETPHEVMPSTSYQLNDLVQSSSPDPDRQEILGAALADQNTTESRIDTPHVFPSSIYPSNELVQSAIPDAAQHEITSTPSADPGTVHIDMKDTSGTGIQVQSENSTGYPNLAYEIGSDETDWLSAALADGKVDTPLS